MAVEGCPHMNNPYHTCSQFCKDYLRKLAKEKEIKQEEPQPSQPVEVKAS